MRELTMSEVAAVSGAVTENQCIGAFTLAGGAIGGAAGFYFGVGIGTFGGAAFGMGVGGAAGLLFCTYLAN